MVTIFAYVNHISILKKFMCVHKKGSILNFTANTKNIVNPNLIDLGIIFFYLFC